MHVWIVIAKTGILICIVICKWHQCLTSCVSHNVFVKFVILKLDSFLGAMYPINLLNVFVCVKIWVICVNLFSFLRYSIGWLWKVGFTQCDLLKLHSSRMLKLWQTWLASTAHMYNDSQYYAFYFKTREKIIREHWTLYFLHQWNKDMA